MIPTDGYAPKGEVWRGTHLDDGGDWHYRWYAIRADMKQWALGGVPHHTWREAMEFVVGRLS